MDESETVDLTESLTTDSDTRPKTAPRHAHRPPGGRKVMRYTLDLEHEQHRFLKLFSIQHNVSASKVMRTMLYMLETDHTFVTRVMGEVFDQDE